MGRTPRLVHHATKGTLGAALAVVLAGCGKAQLKAVREEFSRSKSCPVEQVEARARTDLKESDFTSWPKPPADIAGDSARRAVWEKNLQEQKDGLDRQSNVYEAKGCGQHVVLACKQRKNNALAVTCAEGKPPPGGPAW